MYEKGVETCDVSGVMSNGFTPGHPWRAVWETSCALYPGFNAMEEPVVQMHLSGVESWHGFEDGDRGE